jgi:anti-sigma regulatory factor (Ser/Thr protein kinase)
MTDTEGQPLTFGNLDGLAFAATRGRLHAATPSLHFVASDIGPLLEFSQLSSDGLLPRPDKAPWLVLDGIDNFYAALLAGHRQWFSPDSKTLGFLRLEQTPPTKQTAWTAFGLAAQQAATAFGFPRPVAAQFVAAIEEMQSNVYEHSGAPLSGVMAYKASDTSFEFVVTDRGVGILNSLKSCPKYAHLADHGDALRLALTDGISRYGEDVNHGHGFRPLFVGLANLSGSLRFRSGDHALTIDGQNLAAISAKAAEKPLLTGFLASIACVLAPVRV